MGTWPSENIQAGVQSHYHDLFSLFSFAFSKKEYKTKLQTNCYCSPLHFYICTDCCGLLLMMPELYGLFFVPVIVLRKVTNHYRVVVAHSPYQHISQYI